jgi:hypothetical protein
MAVKKTVAAEESVTPETAVATSVGELEALEEVTDTVAEASFGASEAAAVAKSKIAALAKARASKAAKAQARREASESISAIQRELAAEKANDHLSFGAIREVARVMPTKEEYVKVEIPSADLFDHTHPGVQLNRHRFEPGKTYLLRGDVALEVKKRLAMFHDEQVRLLRPNADRKALNDVNRGSQWTSRGGNSVVPLGRLEDVATASDERIYTVDF